MSSTRTTPSSVTATATLPPSPEIMWTLPLTRSMRSGPGGLIVCEYTVSAHPPTRTTATTSRPLTHARRRDAFSDMAADSVTELPHRPPDARHIIRPCISHEAAKGPHAKPQRAQRFILLLEA